MAKSCFESGERSPAWLFVEDSRTKAEYRFLAWIPEKGEVVEVRNLCRPDRLAPLRQALFPFTLARSIRCLPSDTVHGGPWRDKGRKGGVAEDIIPVTLRQVSGTPMTRIADDVHETRGQSLWLGGATLR